MDASSPHRIPENQNAFIGRLPYLLSMYILSDYRYIAPVS